MGGKPHFLSQLFSLKDVPFWHATGVAAAGWGKFGRIFDRMGAANASILPHPFAILDRRPRYRSPLNKQKSGKSSGRKYAFLVLLGNAEGRREYVKIPWRESSSAVLQLRREKRPVSGREAWKWTSRSYKPCDYCL